MWTTVEGEVVRGHRVASGASGDPRFPGGTLRMQRSHFAARGLDLGAYHAATLNVRIAPCTFALRQPRHTFHDVQWHPTEPAESFSFCDARIRIPAGRPLPALVYVPHPETKPEHHQPPDVVELLAPLIDGVSYGDRLCIEIAEEQATIRCP